MGLLLLIIFQMLSRLARAISVVVFIYSLQIETGLHHQSSPTDRFFALVRQKRWARYLHLTPGGKQNKKDKGDGNLDVVPQLNYDEVQHDMIISYLLWTEKWVLNSTVLLHLWETATPKSMLRALIPVWSVNWRWSATEKQWPWAVLHRSLQTLKSPI